MLLICHQPKSSKSKTFGAIGWDFLHQQQKYSVCLENEVTLAKGVHFGKKQQEMDLGCPPSERFPFCAHPRVPRRVAGALPRGVHRVMPAWGGDVLPSTVVRLSCIPLHRARRGPGPCRDGTTSHLHPSLSPPFSFFFFSTFPSILLRLLPQPPPSMAIRQRDFAPQGSARFPAPSHKPGSCRRESKMLRSYLRGEAGSVGRVCAKAACL